jgi:hypothetical protein
MAHERTATTGPDRFLLGIVAGTVLLVVVSIVVVLMVGRSRPTPPADPASPAGVVQAYIEAWRVGDVERAHSYLTREARAEAESRDRTTYRPSADDNNRIVVETVSMTGTTAEVKVTISRFQARSDPFSAGTYHRDVTVRLLREDGEWRISRPIEPYVFF